MLQNIKVDIIYFLTATDFEMEFNLCGCCRMRLLTDKAADRKSFIHMLSRAVSRSRVIICCGSLFGDAGLINGVAAAIGKQVVKVDNAAYGIKNSGDIGIIDGSMPLVTPEGIFGGCIIESGPQAIIVLSESKAIRKSIMNTLIHSYIEELSVTPIKTVAPVSQETAPATEPSAESKVENASEEQETVPNSTSAENTADGGDIAIPDAPVPTAVVPVAVPVTDAVVVPEQNADTAENDSVQEIAEPEAVADTAQEETETEEPTVPLSDIAQNDDPSAEVIEQETALNEEVQPTGAQEAPEKEKIPPEEDDGLYIEAQQVKFTKKHYYDVDYEAGADSDQYYAEPDPINYHLVFRLPILIITVVLLISLLILAYFLVFVPMRDGYTFSEYVKEIFAVASVGIKPL